MTQWQRIHIFDELEKHGIEITVFNPLKYKSYLEANNELIKLIVNKSFDLFMTGIGGEKLFIDTLEKIKNKGILTLLICFDNLHAPYMHKRLAPLFNLVWLTSKETMYLFKKWGCNNIIFQPYAANPYVFNPNWTSNQNIINFIGTPYGSRLHKINSLLKNNIQCHVYSNQLIKIDEPNNVEKISYLNVLKNIVELMRFPIGRKVFCGAVVKKLFYNKEHIITKNEYLDISPSVSFDEMKYIYANNSLSLNITELRNTYVLKKPLHKLHLRTFEIPMCGGLELTSHTEELASYFDEGKEIVLYKSEEELLSKAKFYLNPKNNNLILKMKKKARARAVKEHTWSNRFEAVFDRLEK